MKMKIFHLVATVFILADCCSGEDLLCYVCDGDDCLSSVQMKHQVCGPQTITTEPHAPVTRPNLAGNETPSTKTAKTTAPSFDQNTGYGKSNTTITTEPHAPVTRPNLGAHETPSTKTTETTTPSFDQNNGYGQPNTTITTTIESVTTEAAVETTTNYETTTTIEATVTTANETDPLATTTTNIFEPKTSTVANEGEETIKTTSGLEASNVLHGSAAKTPPEASDTSFNSELIASTEATKQVTAESTKIEQQGTTATIENEDSKLSMIKLESTRVPAEATELELTTSVDSEIRDIKTESTTKTPETTTIAKTSSTIISTIVETATTTEADLITTTIQNSEEKILLTQRSWSASDQLPNNYRSYLRVRRDAISLAYSCYSAEYSDNNQTKMRKGCVAVPAEKPACQFVAEEMDHKIVAGSCKICATNLCNSGVIQRISTSLILIIMFVKYLM